MERRLQTKIIRWLKAQGAYVIKTRPGMGTPVGCPDIFFVYGKRWGVIEVKSSAGAHFQPGQEATLERLRDWNPTVYVVNPENWDIIKAQLSISFF